jgi:hypothetical protein
MSKAQRIRQQSAQQRIAAQRAAARRAEVRRRILLAAGSVAVVVAIVVAFVVIKLNQGGGPASKIPTTGQALPASVMTDITAVPVATLKAIGPGSVPSYLSRPVRPASDSPLTSGGKPELLYIGAEFCPYCAELRWSMVVALSRFGGFAGPLRGIRSSATDVFPSTATLTFYKAPAYSSRYLTFTPVENEDVNHNRLQPVTAQQQAIWFRHSPGGGYPFLDFGGKAVITSPIYNPQVLQGKDWAQIAAALRNPASPIAQGVLGAANYITAAICKMTGNKPASVCNSAVLVPLEAGF